MSGGDGGDVSAALDWRFSQVFGERAAGEEVQEDIPTKILHGKSTAKDFRLEIVAEISRMKDAITIFPRSTVILVGEIKESATYVRNKKKACESVGINSYEVNLIESSTEKEVLKFISNFNDDSTVHGILVQLPLPF